MKELEYRGYRVVEVNYNPVQGDLFSPDRAYTVLDGFDDPLPILQQLHWTPFEAMAAIDILIDAPDHTISRRWPSTITYEYNKALVFRKHWSLTYVALLDIESLCRNAQDFDDNPAAAILDRISKLKSTVQSF